MKTILVFSFLLANGFFACAQEGPRADARQATQRIRIATGRSSGEVTAREATGLNSEHRDIRRSERRAKSDGVVNSQERIRIERKQDRANRHIRRAKHNSIGK